MLLPQDVVGEDATSVKAHVAVQSEYNIHIMATRYTPALQLGGHTTNQQHVHQGHQEEMKGAFHYQVRMQPSIFFAIIV